MSNIDRLRTVMAEKELSAMLLSDINSVQWATGFTGSAGLVILTPSEGVFLTDSRYTIQAKEQVEGLEVDTFSSSQCTQAEFMATHAKRLGIQELGFESGSATYSSYADWGKKLDRIALIPVDSLVGPLRAVKTEQEISLIRDACKLADACIEHASRMIQPGVVEFDLQLDIEFFFRRHRADIAFEPIVVSGLNSARPHGRATEKKLETGDFVTLDIGCKIDGYCSDITRTFVVSQASERHERIYSAVLESQLAALDAMKPGVSGKEVDQVSRDVLAKHGLAEYFGHGLGHGLGKLVHDAGSLSPRSETILEPGMVLTVEPGVYIEGFGGVRIEDDVVVTDSGIEILTHAPKSLQVLP